MTQSKPAAPDVRQPTGKKLSKPQQVHFKKVQRLLNELLGCNTPF